MTPDHAPVRASRGPRHRSQGIAAVPAMLLVVVGRVTVFRDPQPTEVGFARDLVLPRGRRRASRGRVSFLARLLDLGILAPHEPDRFSPADVRRVLLANSLEQAGIPLEGVGAAMQRGSLSLDFLDAASYERFAALATESFRQGEVLVSQAVVDASQDEGIAFADIGPVELKGVSRTVHLLRADLV